MNLDTARDRLSNGYADFAIGARSNHGKDAVGAPSFGVHAPFRNYFPVEMRHLLDQPDVLQQRGTAQPSGEDIDIAFVDLSVAIISSPLL
jgi:hypothetical protein